MVILIIFIASGLGIVALLGHKHFEISTGKRTFISHATNYTNNHVTKGVRVAQTINMENATKIVGLIVAHSIRLLQRFSIYIKNRSYSKKIVDVVTGKGEQKNTSGASIFLKRIKDHDRVDSL